MIVAWINFIILNVCGILLTYIGKISLMPATREEKRGEKAWEECERYRSLGGILELIMVINMILWIWFPIPEVSWILHDNFFFGIIIAFCIGVPSVLLVIKGTKDAGKETYKPSKDTEMFGGIYQYIRHPQNFGEFMLFIAFAFGFNSIFLIIWSIISVGLYLPIIIYYEEKDLIKRFGDAYIKYKGNTGAIFPKFWKSKK